MADTDKVVTLQDVADLTGVHKSTVHRALRGDPRVEAGTIARIREAASQLGYDPDINQAARRLSLRKSGRSEPNRLIALLFPVVFTHGSYFQRLFTGFVEALSAAHHDVLTRVHDREDLPLPALVSRGEADAVVVLNQPQKIQGIRAAIEAMPTPLRRPLISMLYPVPGLWSVVADIRLGGRMAMDHLLDLGHRRILTVAGMAYGGEERIAGCREALASRGLPADQHLVAMEPDLSIADPDRRLADVLDRLLAAAPDATAIMAPHDQAACKLARMLLERGLPVPARMSLIGFDDTDIIPAADGTNQLTSVALPLERIGGEAAAMAIDPGPRPRSIVLPASLRARGTTRSPSA